MWRVSEEDTDQGGQPRVGETGEVGPQAEELLPSQVETDEAGTGGAVLAGGGGGGGRKVLDRLNRSCNPATITLSWTAKRGPKIESALLSVDKLGGCL